MKENLKESRYRHSLGVEEMAVRLAETWGEDIEKAGYKYCGRVILTPNKDRMVFEKILDDSKK